MNRRVMLTLLGRSTVAGFVYTSSTFRTAHAAMQALSGSIVAQASSSTFESQMQAYIAATETREYSEEGVPMIVVCEDLTAQAPAPPVYSKSMNDTLAPLYRTYVETWSRLQPNAPAVDAGKLLEFLSSRHFFDGGRDGTL